jgi:hypothetical protein
MYQIPALQQASDVDTNGQNENALNFYKHFGFA